MKNLTPRPPALSGRGSQTKKTLNLSPCTLGKGIGGLATMPDRPPRVLFAASEVVGFAKTGGLADVAGSLPRALAKRGLEVAVVLPLYHAVRTGRHTITPTDIRVSIPHRRPQRRRVESGEPPCPIPDVPVYLVEQAELFERDDPHQGRGLYQFTGPDGRKQDYSDNADRFIFFSRAVMEALPQLGVDLRRVALQRLADGPDSLLLA